MKNQNFNSVILTKMSAKLFDAFSDFVNSRQENKDISIIN